MTRYEEQEESRLQSLECDRQNRQRQQQGTQEALQQTLERMLEVLRDIEENTAR